MQQGEFSGYEFAAGSVKGARAFKVDEFGRLTGVAFEKVWQPGENEAKCYAGELVGFAIGGVVGLGSVQGPIKSVNHNNQTITVVDRAGRQHVISIPSAGAIYAPSPPSPHDMAECKCGFYGFYDGSNDYASEAGGIYRSRENLRVSAVVEGYGRTVIGSRGFRASKARILALCLPPDRAELRRRQERKFVSIPLRWPLALRAGLATVGLLMGIAGLTIGALHFHEGGHNPLLVLTSIPLLGFAGWCWLAEMKMEHVRIETAYSFPTEFADKIRRNYPDVPVFDTFAAMVAAFPPDKDIEPTPSDATFWSDDE